MSKKQTKPEQTTRVVRVSTAAKEHLFRVVDQRRAQGLSASGTSILNELIFSLPLPEGK
jgi:hypothetical protein